MSLRAMKTSNWGTRLLAGAFALLASVATAQTSTDVAAGSMCPNADIFSGGIVSKVCWDCFFPMRIGGAADYSTMPLGSAAPVCTCPGRLFGYPTTGPTLGIWMPGHIVEIVRHPYCSPTLGHQLSGGASGANSGAVASALNGMHQGGSREHTSDQRHDSFFNMHYFNFPVSQLLDQLVDSVCVAQSGADMEVLYFTEIDPTWSNDALALQLNPEAALFNNPVGLAACIVDAAAASITQPIPALIWCAGAWGTLYPPSGHIPAHQSAQQDASLAAARGLSLIHQRGLGLLTYTDAAVCRDIPWPTLPKNQYKLQTMHPMAETLTNHWIGATTFRWGEWRHIPAIGEDFVYLVWNWQECCGNI